MARDDDYAVNGEKLLPDKITALKNMGKSFNLKVRGFELDTSNNKWMPMGEALASSEVIIMGTGIISSFTESANLITTKEKEKFMMEFADGFFKFNVAVLNSEGTPYENHRVVIKMFKDTLSNVGDIITGSRELLKGQLDPETGYQQQGYE